MGISFTDSTSVFVSLVRVTVSSPPGEANPKSTLERLRYTSFNVTSVLKWTGGITARTNTKSTHPYAYRSSHRVSAVFCTACSRSISVDPRVDVVVVTNHMRWTVQYQPTCADRVIPGTVFGRGKDKKKTFDRDLSVYCSIVVHVDRSYRR